MLLARLRSQRCRNRCLTWPKTSWALECSPCLAVLRRFRMLGEWIQPPRNFAPNVPAPITKGPWHFLRSDIKYCRNDNLEGDSHGAFSPLHSREPQGQEFRDNFLLKVHGYIPHKGPITPPSLGPICIFPRLYSGDLSVSLGSTSTKHVDSRW